jgi:DNA repair protein RecN (Recombination protein N)
MLLELHIKNLALIDEARIEFEEGFNVITGETGAGKTVIVGAVNLLLGARADSTHIRKGCSKAEVTGVFSRSMPTDNLSEALRDIIDHENQDQENHDDRIIVRRVISMDGKNKCYVNDTAVTVASFGEIGSRCIDLHGQHEHQSLFKTSTHVDFLDSFGGPKLLDLREKFTKLSLRYKKLKEKRDRLKNAEREFLGRKDLLAFQVGEIEDADLTIGEDEELLKERDVLRNAEKIFAAISGAGAALGGADPSGMTAESSASATEAIAGAVANLDQVEDFDPKLKALGGRLNEILIELEDCSAEIRDYVDEFQVEPGRLEEVEGRLALISLLKRKYGQTIDEIIAYSKKAKDELDMCDTSSEAMEKLDKDIAITAGELGKVAETQGSARRKIAKEFAGSVCRELSELNMPNAKFDVLFTREQQSGGVIIGGEAVKLQANGIDRVEFMVSANKGEALKPLTKVASGGEISRIMLAIKIILADTDKTPTMIFDEIDTGIGGKTAADVGRKMALLARRHQVLSVTHLPQIASFADKHITVSKRDEGERTVTEVLKLDYGEKIKEMARLLSGNIESNMSLKHAEELLMEARETKCRV